MRTFEFVLPDNRRAITGAIMIPVLLFITILSGKMMDIPINWLLGVGITEFLVLAVILIKWMWRKERLVFYPDYLESALYGKIPYKNMIEIESPWYLLYPGFTLRLIGKRSCHWVISHPRPSKPLSNTQDEVDAFNHFKEILKKNMDDSHSKISAK
ncbi:hypothetical protein CEY12_04260 [Chryseobacterium sp. T16E-39]|uniref:hypothetical protein n=1 Tax=Chryseobacterium sp. T16E-39 TaxID=2015076 RepID=UPI000B5B1F8A|nr:hypothetical protein [Chryseobacterium sp. T16E-39]ASK29358.1 hypothetical protein CEY12_04260 [Chryseobacterium sp. T16E-39]